MRETPEIIAELKEKYRGLREEDLEKLNPSYSCVICCNPDCPKVGRTYGSCPQQVTITEEEFAARYDFDKEQ